MPWILLDVLIGVLATAVLCVVAFSLYRHARGLIRTLGAASARVGEALPSIPAPRS